ncbi:glycosyltransferase family 4 protein [Pontibacter indicus]|uniref:Glycosyltransferase involved in cell wall bisynthesis n=1 Tax=Pontibacter indicus TaxID=1317125 RepID=A0A1R3WC62_9BACT|nr:glycosyltransferase [Pontibacter indicus]SIT75488.1 Glycosyltransferase involved in cell wall bisynthesis [Pontibacter indicus]
MSKIVFYDDQIINILLTEERPSGGASVQAYGWIKGLLEYGHEVYIITDLSRVGTLKDECRDIKLIPSFNYQKGIRWFRWLYYRMPYLYRELKRVKPDYLYKGIPSWHSFLIGIICYHLDINFIQRISNDFLIDKRFFNSYSKVHWAFQNMGMRLSDYILCQNDYQFKIIHSQFPKKSIKKLCNPICLRSNEIMDVTHREYIAWLGLFQYQKNLKLLYEIATKLPQENFLIAGKESSEIDPDTIYYLGKLKELHNVQFYGFIKRDQVLPFLAKAKFLLNTSHYEGFSNTFLEAMAVGTPILTSTKVNPDAIISEYDLGIVYNDASDLVEKLKELQLENYKSLSTNVVEYLSSKHDYKILTQELMKFLNSHKSVKSKNLVVT